MKRAFIFLAEGFEDTEALGTLDVLRRGGIDASLVSITEDPFVVSSRGVAVGVDYCFCELDNIDSEDIMIFPGGMPGTKNLAACDALIEKMKGHHAKGGTLAAICAAPGLVLSQLPSLESYTLTCFDGFESYIEAKGGKYDPKPAISCGDIITGRSAGYSLYFGLEILRKLSDEANVERVRKGLFLD